MKGGESKQTADRQQAYDHGFSHYRHLRAGGDEGVPIVVSDPDSEAAVALTEAAEAVVRATKSKVGKPLQLMAR